MPMILTKPLYSVKKPKPISHSCNQPIRKIESSTRLTFPFLPFFVVIPAEAGIQSKGIRSSAGIESHQAFQDGHISDAFLMMPRHKAWVQMSDLFAERVGSLDSCLRRNDHKPVMSAILH
jgi:hypothetical protein